MTKEEVPLKLLLDKLLNIKELIDDTKNIGKYMKKLKANDIKETSDDLEKVKDLIDQLFNSSSTLKDQFYVQYREVKCNLLKDSDCFVSKRDRSDKDMHSIENSRSEGTRTDMANLNSATAVTDDKCSSADETLVLSNDISPSSGNVEPIIEDMPEKVSELEDTLPLPNETKDKEHLFPSDEKQSIDEEGQKEMLDETRPLSDPLEDTTALDKSPLKNVEAGKVCEESSSDGRPKSLIRLVDLSKLIDPKPKKSVKFDSSVIILSSDEEFGSAPKKKNSSPDPPITLRSALKNSPSPTEESKTHKKILKLRNQSYSEDGENRSNPSVESDSDEGSKEKELARKKKGKIRNALESERKYLESNVTLCSDEEEPRISSRLKQKQKQKLKYRSDLKKIFKRTSGDSSFEIISKQSNKTEEDNSSSDREIKRSKMCEKKTKGNKRDTDENEEKDKFVKKLYIPLPKIECEKLKEMYLRKEEILDIKSSPKLDCLRQSKRIYKDDSKSGDAVKPLPKKCKTKKPHRSENSDSDEVNSDSDDRPISILPDCTEDKPTKDEDESSRNIYLENLEPKDECNQDKIIEDNSGSEEDNINISISKKFLKNKKETGSEKIDENKSEEQEGVSESEIVKDSDLMKKSEAKSNHTEKEADKKEEKECTTNSSDESSKNNEKDVENKKRQSDDEIEDKKENADDNSSNTDENDKKTDFLTKKIDSSDSDEEFGKFCKRREQSREALVSDDESPSPTNLMKSKAKKRIKKHLVISDSDDSDSGNKNRIKESDSEADRDKSDDEPKSGSSSEDDDKDKKKTKSKRKRIKRTKDSSSSDEDRSTRKQIRRVLDRDSLSETTKKAEEEEKKRKARIAEKQKKYNNYFEEKKDSTIEKLVLDHDEKTGEALLKVHKEIVKKLKPHQANGIQFMWDACFESVKRARKSDGSGCILAHCMGLGKTLQVIALSHILLTNSDKTNVNKILVVCPLSTVLNWKSEFNMWLPSKSSLDVYELASCKKVYEREYIVKEWHEEGGVLIISYAMFRNISNPDNKKISKKMRATFKTGLVDPGPDLVVCDEGHLLKNEKTNLSIAMNRIRTARRIVLTGTPLQNNLKEYWCMVQFIKPNLLGTYKEYMNRFVNPITNGQYTDSTPRDIEVMRKRSHVLHKLLDGVVQRRDYSVLEPYLPPKYEYVLFVSLTETQVKLYKYYMQKYARQNDGSNRTSFLFTDFQKLQRICTHPRVLMEKGGEKREKFDDEDEESEGSLKDFIDDGDESASTSSKSDSSGSESGSDDSREGNKKTKSSRHQQRARVTRAQAAQRRENNDESDPELVEMQKEWWQDFCDGDELDNINNSGKLILLFEILKECEEIGDKILVFSQSLYTLNCIEYFLEKIDAATQNDTSEKIGGHKGSWSLGLDYFRLDGSSSCDNRHSWCDEFNDPNNTRARLFLISTKAGGLGINLVAANRVIIFDVSWNPSHDVQSIYRVYRFGQTKPCYIYRFVSYGAMEMKIYERQVTKQAISKRVIDEQQIDRHYNQNDLQELYKCDLEPEVRPIPLVPKDVLLGEMLQKHEKTIFTFHLHQSLLENKEDEGLNEEERKAAWEEFENEKVLRKSNYDTHMLPHMNQGMNAQTIALALTNIVKKDNPTWSEVQIKGIIPALVQQLQVQLSENDTSMYTRVLQEIQLMRAQKMREAYYQNQMLRLIQQQQNQQAILGNLSVNPESLGQFYGNVGNYFANMPNVSGLNMPNPNSSNSAPRPNDIIELND